MESRRRKFARPCGPLPHVICGGDQDCQTTVVPLQGMSQMYEHFVHRDCSRLIVFFPLGRFAESYCKERYTKVSVISNKS